MTAADRTFFGWRVVRGAALLAACGWGFSFYGPPVFLHAVQASRGWPVSVISAAVTVHFLVGAVLVVALPGAYARLGVVATTRAGAVATAVGVLGWALAREPWQLHAAAVVSGVGWAATSGAAVNGVVAPWFDRDRPAALATAYNGGSVGGVLMPPLWVALIAALGFPWAAAILGGAMVAALWIAAGRLFGHRPEDMGLVPDGRAPSGPPPARRPAPPLPGAALWRNRRFATLVVAASVALFAQIGIVAHLFSLLAARADARFAAAGLALLTACAIVGRLAMGRVLGRGLDRRTAAAGNMGVQIVGGLAMALALGGGPGWLLLPGIALFGLGLGNANSVPPMIAQSDFAAADLARVVALVTAFSQGFYAFAPAAFGLLREAGPAGGGAALLGVTATLHIAAAAIMLAGRRA